MMIADTSDSLGKRRTSKAGMRQEKWLYQGKRKPLSVQIDRRATERQADGRWRVREDLPGKRLEADETTGIVEIDKRARSEIEHR